MSPNQSAKDETGFLLFAQNHKIENILFFLILLFLPTQLGRHFWPSFSYISGIRIDYLSPTVYLTDVLILLLLIFFISRLKLRSPLLIFKKFPWFSLNLLFLIFIFLIGILISKNPGAGFYGLLKFLEFVFLGIYTARFVTKINFKKILLVFSIPIIFESLLSFTQYLRQSSIGGIFYFFGERTFNGQTPGIANASLDGELILRAYGTFSHPNVLGGYLVLAMTLILFNLKIIKNKLEKFFYFICLAVGTLGLFLTFSRIALLLWLSILVIFIVFRIGGNFFKKNAFPIFIFIVLIIFFIFYTSLLLRFSILSFSDESFSQRSELFRSSLAIIKKHLLFGTGLNNFLLEFSLSQKTDKIIFYLQPVHNIFLLAAAQAGILGFIYFIYFLSKTFQRIFKKGNLANYKVIVFLSVLILGSFDHYFLTIQQGQLLLSFIFGLMWSKND